MSLLVLKASSDDLFPVTLPVVTEKGVVKVVLGELVLTSGTDLNDRLQDFLLAVDRFGDEMAGKGESHGKIKKDFSVLLESSILQNKDNEVGVYIFRSDLGLWNNRLVLTAEYYYSKTTDMLYAYDVPVPPFAYDKLLANLGSMSNQGLEVGVSFTPIQKKDMELNINMNLSWQKNKLLSLSGEYDGMQMSAADITAMGALSGAGQHGGYNNVVYQIVGQPLGVFYLPHCKGIIEDGNGHYRYDIEDLDKNGTVDLSDGGDRYIAGQATPKVTLGSNISFRYRDWYLSLQMNGAFGHKIFNGTGLAYTNMSSFPDYNVLKGAPEKNIVDQNVSDYWLEKGDYLNLENLTLGYDIPIRKGVVQSLRVSASVNNLATISSYSGLTPMINSYVVNSTMGIDDKRTYPVYRTFSLGLSVQF